MKTREELNALKKEVDTLKKKLAELTEDELKQVTGGNNRELLNPEISPSIPQIDENVICTPVTGYWQGGAMGNQQ